MVLIQRSIGGNGKDMLCEIGGLSGFLNWRDSPYQISDSGGCAEKKERDKEREDIYRVEDR